MLICDVIPVPSQTTPSDPFSSPCNGLFQALPTFVLDGSSRYRLGYLFHSVGEYRVLPLSVSLRSTQPCPNFWYLKASAFDFGALICSRLGLGVFEAGFGPAIPLYFCMCRIHLRDLFGPFFSGRCMPVAHYVPTQISVLLHAIRAGSPYGILVWLCSRCRCFWRIDRIRRSTNQLWAPSEDLWWEWWRVRLEDLVLDRGITRAIKKISAD